jgi:hypothetical protein
VNFLFEVRPKLICWFVDVPAVLNRLHLMQAATVQSCQSEAITAQVCYLGFQAFPAQLPPVARSGLCSALGTERAVVKTERQRRVLLTSSIPEHRFGIVVSIVGPSASNSLIRVVATPMMVTVIIMKAGAALQTDQSPQETASWFSPFGRVIVVLRFIEMSGIRKFRKCVASTLRQRAQYIVSSTGQTVSGTK